MTASASFLADQRPDRLTKIDPKVKIVSFFALAVISTTTPRGAYGAFVGYLALLLVISLLGQVDLFKLIKRVSLALPFVLLLTVSLPFFGQKGDSTIANFLGFAVYREGMVKLISASARATVAIISVSMLSVSTPFDELMRGFGELKTPKLFLAIASFMQRYLHLFAEEATRMRRARDSRGYNPKWIWQSKTIAMMIGSIFLRSYERGERVYTSMLSRGYDGTIRSFKEIKRVAPGDLVLMALIITAAISIRLFIK